MRLDQITLKNLRSFERLELEFDEQLTLLVGRNGAGKSTVLDGIAVAVGAWLSAIPSVSEDFTFKKNWARLIKGEVQGVAVAEPTFPIRVEARGAVGTTKVQWARELGNATGRTTRKEAHDLRRAARSLADRAGRGDGETLPVFAYFGTGRLWVQKRDTSAVDKSRFAGYRAALEAASDHKGFESWMKRLEKDRIQRLARAHDAGQSLDGVKAPLLDAVSETACGCLESARRLYHSANHDELLVDFEDGQTIPFADLSDGQRTVIAMAADLAWRATQLNPHLGPSAPRQTHGIVLIDEVELHLHPGWQRRVLPDLMEAFPRVQFVVTTHSPQVMSSIPAGAVRLLDGQQAHPLRPQGKTTDVILASLMGVPARPEKVQDQLDELDRLIDDEAYDEASTLLEELEGGTPGADDPDVVAARWELDMALRSRPSSHGNAPD